MARQKAFSQDGEVNGRSVQSIIDGVGQFSATYEKRAREILSNNGIEDPQPGTWFAMEDYLNAFSELSETVGPKTVSKIGKEIPNVVEWPPEIDSVSAALNGLDDVYQMNHRGGEIGYYDFEKTGDKEGEMECKNPYPPELDEGIITAIVEKFSDGTPFVSVEQVEERGDTLVYSVSW